MFCINCEQYKIFHVNGDSSVYFLAWGIHITLCIYLLFQGMFIGSYIRESNVIYSRLYAYRRRRMGFLKSFYNLIGHCVIYLALPIQIQIKILESTKVNYIFSMYYSSSYKTRDIINLKQLLKKEPFSLNT